jgi:Fic family protein
MRFPRHPPPFQPTWMKVFRECGTRPELAMIFYPDRLSPTAGGHYLHWDELRYREPPPGLSAEEWWVGLKLARRSRAIGLESMTAAYARCPAHAHRFAFASLPGFMQQLHELDRTNVGKLILSTVGNEDVRTEYRVRQLIEEAISSSEIEGARPTTREMARQMVREGRPPSTRDERMILNNWRAMERIMALHREGRKLEIRDLLELHAILGEGALDVPGAAGKLRGPEHEVTVADTEGNVWYRPPLSEGIEARLEALLRFAACEDEESEFIHPIVRAIVCHFWLAYEHPFRDGNGRMARALFYWCMLRYGYEMAEFLSISGPIDRSPKKYYLAFAHAETDEGDLTYFVLHQLEVMREALDELLDHLRERASSTARLQRALVEFDSLNHRQRALLQHAIRHPLSSYTIEGHGMSHQVHYMTARKDLANLVERGFLEARQDGAQKRFHPSKRLKKALDGKR